MNDEYGMMSKDTGDRIQETEEKYFVASFCLLFSVF